MTSVAPFLIFFVGAAIAAVTKGRLRAAVLVAVPLVGAVNLVGLSDGAGFEFGLLDYTLTPVRVDRLSFLFGLVFHLAAFLGIIFSLHVGDRVEQVAALLYAGSALGAVFAGDLITLFLFWELLAVTSALLVLARRTDRAYRAAMRYLIIQVSSGAMLFAGALIHANQT